MENGYVPLNWPRRLIASLNWSDDQARQIAGTLTAEALNWKPAPSSWSVGQCLHHLYVANQVYVPPMARALDGRQPAPVDEITPGWFGRWFIRSYIEPSSRSRRSRAPRKIAPAPLVDTSIVDLFVRSNDTARDLVQRASAHDVNRIRFVNPFVPLVRFTVGTGLEIICRHQRRHLLQADAIKQQLLKTGPVHRRTV